MVLTDGVTVLFPFAMAVTLGLFNWSENKRQETIWAYSNAIKAIYACGTRVSVLVKT